MFVLLMIAVLSQGHQAPSVQGAAMKISREKSSSLEAFPGIPPNNDDKVMLFKGHNDLIASSVATNEFQWWLYSAYRATPGISGTCFLDQDQIDQMKGFAFFQVGSKAYVKDFRNHEPSTPSNARLPRIPMALSFKNGIWNYLNGLISGCNGKTGTWRHGLIERYDAAWIMDGAIYDDKKEKRYFHGCRVPDSFYRAVLLKRGEKYDVAAFLMPNENIKLDHLYDYVVSVDEIEKKTGLELFVRVPSEYRNSLLHQKISANDLLIEIDPGGKD